MKKYFLSVFVFTLLALGSLVSAQNLNLATSSVVAPPDSKAIPDPNQDNIIDSSLFDEAFLYVPSLQTDKPQYSGDEKITGEFLVDNNSDIRRSDMYVTTSIETEVDGKKIEVDIQKHNENLYLEAKARRRKISFEHILSNKIVGNVNLFVRVYSRAGALLGEKSAPLNIVGIQNKPFVVFATSSISVNKDDFPLQAGPTVSSNDTVSLNIYTKNLKKSHSVIPTITLYNRTYTSESVKTIVQKPIILENSKKYTFSLPTDMDAKVYAGILSFESDNAQIPPIYFRYIVGGNIGTILNANSDILSGKKGDRANIKLEYAGTPYAFNDSGFQFPTSTATIEVTLSNDKDEIVGKGTTDISLNKAGSVIVPIVLAQDAKNLVINAKIKLGEAVLSEYHIVLPSENDLQNIYGSSKKSSNLYLILSIVFALLLVVVFFVVKKKYNKASQKILPILFLFATLSAFTLWLPSVKAFGYLWRPSANESNYFSVNSVTSPGPSDSISYAPGQTFTFHLNASFVACNNAGFTNKVYTAPLVGWNTGAFDPSNIYANWPTVYANWGDYWGHSVNLPNLATWWTATKGGILYFSTSGYSNTVFISGSDFTGSYDINGSTFTMPNTPGFQQFYFMLQNDSSGGNTAVAMFAAQRICIRGAGVCPTEVVDNSTYTCPNLTGTGYSESGGIIYQNGVITNFIKDVSGNCVVKNACYPASDPVSLNTSCGCSATGVVGKIGCAGACVSSTTSMVIPSACAFSLTCLAVPTSVAVNSATTITAYPSYNTGTTSYVWSGLGSDISYNGNDHRVVTTSFSYRGTKTISSTGTDSLNATAVNSCSVAVGCDMGQHSIGDPAGCVNGYVSSWQCPVATWIRVSTDVPCLCSSLDGITVSSTSNKTFYKNRIAKTCEGSEAICIDGNLKQANATSIDFASSTYKYRTCVTPVPSEF